MRFNKLDLNLLVALDAMLHTRSITTAAKQLHTTQSAMSNCLARLRDYFEDELLVKVGRNLELTKRGEMLRDEVHDLLLRIDTAITTQPEFNAQTSDRIFRIAASDYTVFILFPLIQDILRKASATVRFQLIPQVGNAAITLERGDADVLIVPRMYCSAEHPAEVIFTESFRCLLWSHSALASKPLDEAAYLEAGHVAMVPTGSDKPNFSAWALNSIDINRRVEATTYSFLTEPLLVIGTDRIATVHTRIASWATADFPLIAVQPPVPIPLMEQSMQWHKYRTTDPGLQWVLGIIRQASVKLLSPDHAMSN